MAKVKGVKVKADYWAMVRLKDNEILSILKDTGKFINVIYPDTNNTGSDKWIPVYKYIPCTITLHRRAK